MSAAAKLPLAGLRVVELAGELADSGTRLLADLGAEVVKVEPPEGAAGRRRTPMGDISRWAWHLNNANKLGVVLDAADVCDMTKLRDLVDAADILVDCWGPGRLADAGLEPGRLTAEVPGLVVVQVSAFGQTGPYRDLQATEHVLYAMGGVLSRSGFPGAEPLLPPVGLVEGHTGAHVAWAALLAHYQARRTHRGESVDVSAYEAVVHGLDPVFGTQGSAAAARPDTFPRGRPDSRNYYPVYRCADGHVRTCLLSRRQWRAMFEWLGSPEEFADPKFDAIPARFHAAERLNAGIQEFFDRHTRAELVEEGAERGIPIAEVLDVADVLTVPHFVTSGVLADVEIAPGVTARVPSGQVRVDGVRAGHRSRCPELGEHDDVVLGADGFWPPRVLPAGPELADGDRPFAGLRVLDLGVNVFGAELGRQFADNGADVIKVENAAYPDGLRQSRREGAFAASFAWGNRNKRGLGLNLRSPRGVEIFRSLVATADVVVANFKPGTLAGLGLTHEILAEINPRTVICDASAFGNVGEWRKRLGYGPLVRASCGVSALWAYPDVEYGSADGSTVYPDHVASQVAAVSVLAGLIARLESGRGCLIELAQSDVALTHLGGHLAAESLQPGSVGPEGNIALAEAPSGVFPCAGDDEWCVVSVRDDDDWARLCRVVGRPELADHPLLGNVAGRLRNRAAAAGVLTQWLIRRDREESIAALQQAGVPAGLMARGPDQLDDAQLTARCAFADLEHPALPMTLRANLQVATYTSVPVAPLLPAPVLGEHTREIAASLLGLADQEVEALVAEGILQPE
ncbi:CaiB/BaiF CoA transferase family protein [Streptomyces hirsutus]|uniref:CaiB/BaiF CoA transferase family protein n=1 Tax=Streptomyces hirsutus TaxID=35620 RepID=UPI0036B4FA36